ncbi:hypothetical protein Slin14017_G101250 [Septoria linicola]|nr:hypothetical protein Slin14017_G101250 [Septoria linicola]
MSTLTSNQRQLLHEVADGLLDIYQTLVRMQYLEPERVHRGPHDLSAHQELYESLNLDVSIIYLYSIMPYVDAGRVTEIDFFQGSYFSNFRNKAEMEQGRHPMYGDDEDLLRPWMTPLCGLGNHYGMIVYDAASHGIAMCHQDGGPSSDQQMGATEQQLENSDPDEGYSSEGEDMWIEDDEEEENNDRNEWDEMEMRPAKSVLRNMVSRFEDLTELPGTGENSGYKQMWQADVIKLVYRKHGWPGADFDGHAFRVSRVRADADKSAREERDKILEEVRHLKLLDEAVNDDERWLARLHLYHVDQGQRNNCSRLADAEADLERLTPEPEEMLVLRTLPIVDAIGLDASRNIRASRITLEKMRNESEEERHKFSPPGRLAYQEKHDAVCLKACQNCHFEANALSDEVRRKFVQNKWIRRDIDVKAAERAVERAEQNVIEIRGFFDRMPGSVQV